MLFLPSKEKDKNFLPQRHGGHRVLDEEFQILPVRVSKIGYWDLIGFWNYSF
jgi:hypothetical protein